MSETFPLTIVIVEKTGTLKTLSIKDFKEEELYKKCSFKKPDDFCKHTEWNHHRVKINGIRYSVSVYGKTEGKAGGENKYDFPPPIDNTLFFGNCAIVCRQILENGTLKYVNLSLELWNQMYEKLFGGFEDLATTAHEDENEIDELALVPNDKKTKHGYLKDGFVVDSDSNDGDGDADGSYAEEESGDFDEEEDDPEAEEEEEGEDEDDITIEDLDEELSEESYVE